MALSPEQQQAERELEQTIRIIAQALERPFTQEDETYERALVEKVKAAQKAGLEHSEEFHWNPELRRYVYSGSRSWHDEVLVKDVIEGKYRPKTVVNYEENLERHMQEARQLAIQAGKAQTDEEAAVVVQRMIEEEPERQQRIADNTDRRIAQAREAISEAVNGLAARVIECVESQKSTKTPSRGFTRFFRKTPPLSITTDAISQILESELIKPAWDAAVAIFIKHSPYALEGLHDGESAKEALLGKVSDAVQLSVKRSSISKRVR